VPLGHPRVLVVMVSATGLVTHKVIEVEERLEPSQLQECANYLNVHFSGMPLAQIRTRLIEMMSEEKALYDSLLQRVIALGGRAFEVRESEASVYLDGASNILAQPEFAIVRETFGTGPFQIAEDSKPNALDLVRTTSNEDEETTEREEVTLSGRPAAAAVQAFLKGDTDLVIGGTFGDLPYTRADEMPKNALRFDPATGLFGLVPARASGPAADPEIRRLLSQAIDRDALTDTDACRVFGERQELKRTAITAQRDKLLALRDEEKIGEDAYEVLQEELDWRELAVGPEDIRTIEEG